MTDPSNDTEAQIERAVERWRHVVGSEYKVRTLLQEFAAGKFREPELPAIAPPPWPYKSVQTNKCIDDKYRVTASGAAGWHEYTGPAASTPRGAIVLWNGVFEGLGRSGCEQAYP